MVVVCRDWGDMAHNYHSLYGKVKRKALSIIIKVYSTTNFGTIDIMSFNKTKHNGCKAPLQFRKCRLFYKISMKQTIRHANEKNIPKIRIRSWRPTPWNTNYLNGKCGKKLISTSHRRLGTQGLEYISEMANLCHTCHGVTRT